MVHVHVCQMSNNSVSQPFRFGAHFTWNNCCPHCCFSFFWFSKKLLCQCLFRNAGMFIAYNSCRAQQFI